MCIWEEKPLCSTDSVHGEAESLLFPSHIPAVTLPQDLNTPHWRQLSHSPTAGTASAWGPPRNTVLPRSCQLHPHPLAQVHSPLHEKQFHMSSLRVMGDRRVKLYSRSCGQQLRNAELFPEAVASTQTAPSRKAKPSGPRHRCKQGAKVSHGQCLATNQSQPSEQPTAHESAGPKME